MRRYSLAISGYCKTGGDGSKQAVPMYVTEKDIVDSRGNL